MKFVIAAVGKAKPGPLRELYHHYAERLTWSLMLKEIDPARHATAEERKKAEGAALDSIASPDSVRIVLDERAPPITSEDFAQFLKRAQLDSVREMVFMIGGADGLDLHLSQKARLSISFGRMTWPHMLVRVMLIEQVYRAQQILAGHPYHRA